MALHETDADLREDGSEVPEPQRPPVPGGISMRPAMIVFGLAALILVVFITIAIVTSQAPTPIKHSDAAVGVPGVTLRAVPAAGLLSPIVTNGEPPTTFSMPFPSLSDRFGSRTRATLRARASTTSR